MVNLLQGCSWLNTDVVFQVNLTPKHMRGEKFVKLQGKKTLQYSLKNEMDFYPGIFSEVQWCCDRTPLRVGQPRFTEGWGQCDRTLPRWADRDFPKAGDAVTVLHRGEWWINLSFLKVVKSLPFCLIEYHISRFRKIRSLPMQNSTLFVIVGVWYRAQLEAGTHTMRARVEFRQNL